MGSTESSEGRGVSFGVEEEERVRVLQGIRVSGGGRGREGEEGAGGSRLEKRRCRERLGAPRGGWSPPFFLVQNIPPSAQEMRGVRLGK